MILSKNMKKTIILLILTFLPGLAFADTINFIDGASLKGLIVEEYSDRYIINTEAGHKEILKKDIKSISYDTPEQNLMQLGKLSENKNDFKSALYYYQEAYKLNSDSLAARDAIERVQGKSLANYSESTREAVDDKILIEKAMSRGVKEVLSEKNLIDKIKDATGMTLTKNGNFVEVLSVDKDSAAFKKGVINKDRIISVWGVSLIYEDFHRALKEIDGPRNLVFKFTIKRDVELNKIEDIELQLKVEGLFVKKSSNPLIKINDLITDINGKNAAYISLKEADNILKNIENYPVRLTIQRNLYLTRE